MWAVGADSCGDHAKYVQYAGKAHAMSEKEHAQKPCDVSHEHRDMHDISLCAQETAKVQKKFDLNKLLAIFLQKCQKIVTFSDGGGCLLQHKSGPADKFLCGYPHQ